MTASKAVNPDPRYSKLTIGVCPDQWGVWFPYDEKQVAWDAALAQMADAGFSIMETGPHGYFPTNPKLLKAVMDAYGFTVVAGTGWAVLSSILGWSSFTMDWVAPFGDIFINLLKLIAIPLVLFSIISGVSGLSDITKLGRTGMGMLGLYLATTFIAVGIGLVLVNMIKPGEMANDDQRMRNRITYELWVNNTPSVRKREGCRRRPSQIRRP